MDKFIVKGPCKIKGEISISGSKNAALPILASTILFEKEVIIKNLPRVKDIDTMINLLKSLGSEIKFNKNRKIVKITKKKKQNFFASYSLVRTMRAGILVLGALVAKHQKSITSLPGGCLIGARPVNYHLNALKKLGMKYDIKKGYIHAHTKEKLKGAKIRFSKISVGATENTIIAACLANGITILRNCAIEPEIIDLINFLKSGGAKIKFIGKRTVKIEGIKSLESTSYSVMSDRIETKNKAFISGDTDFQAAELMSSDLRASVALVLAAIVATGSSTINRIYHLDRGYENIENKLRKVGVNIRRVN